MKTHKIPQEGMLNPSTAPSTRKQAKGVSTPKHCSRARGYRPSLPPSLYITHVLLCSRVLDPPDHSNSIDHESMSGTIVLTRSLITTPNPRTHAIDHLDFENILLNKSRPLQQLVPHRWRLGWPPTRLQSSRFEKKNPQQIPPPATACTSCRWRFQMAIPTTNRSTCFRHTSANVFTLPCSNHELIDQPNQLAGKSLLIPEQLTNQPQAVKSTRIPPEMLTTFFGRVTSPGASTHQFTHKTTPFCIAEHHNKSSRFDAQRSPSQSTGLSMLLPNTKTPSSPSS